MKSRSKEISVVKILDNVQKHGLVYNEMKQV